MALLDPSVLFGLKHFNHQNPREVRKGILSMRKPASREMISASVELCETEVDIRSPNTSQVQTFQNVSQYEPNFCFACQFEKVHIH